MQIRMSALSNPTASRCRGLAGPPSRNVLVSLDEGSAELGRRSAAELNSQTEKGRNQNAADHGRSFR